MYEEVPEVRLEDVDDDGISNELEVEEEVANPVRA